MGAHNHLIITNFDCEIVSDAKNKKFEVVLDKLEELDHETSDDECGDDNMCSPLQMLWFGSESSESGVIPHCFPTPPILPTYCKIVLYSADFSVSSPITSPFCTGSCSPRSSYDFGETGSPLGGVQRVDTLLGRRVKIIGLHSKQAALDYNLGMRMIDDAILQRFEQEVSEATRNALHEADVWIIQQCLSQIAFHTLKLWIRIFLYDRSRPKRLIYDASPRLDHRDMRPQKVLSGVSNWHLSSDKHHHQLSPAPSQSNFDASEDCTHHYVIDFTRSPRGSTKLR